MSTLLEYKCPCCGGAIEFNTTVQKMKCPYCDTEFDMDTLRSYDEELKAAKPEDMEWKEEAGGQWQEGEQEGMLVYMCESCGGEIVGDKTTAATSCPYCGNPVVMKGQFSGDLRPDYVIPFKLDKKAAKEALSRHFHGKRLLPKAFKDENHIDEVKGVYVPFWLFNAQADADVSYNATKVRRWSDSRYNYKETSHYFVTREGDIGFERVSVDGSSKMDDTLMESIEPFDFKDAVDFQTAYLAGYLADKYDVTADQSKDRANQRIKRSTEDAFRNTVKGYTTVVTANSNIRLTENSVKYALYPVWVLTTSWKDGSYIFAMNGQTGKMVGNLPLDKGAFARWFIGVFAAVSAAASLFGLLFM